MRCTYECKKQRRQNRYIKNYRCAKKVGPLKLCAGGKSGPLINLRA